MQLVRTAVTSALLLLGAMPSSAGEAVWRVRFYGFYMGTDGAASFEDAAGTVLSSDNDSGAGFGVAAEYAVSRRLGLELGVSLADHGDFRARPVGGGPQIEASDTLSLLTLAVALNYHVAPDAAADFHLGPILALVDFDDLGIHYDANNAPLPPAPSSVRIGFDSALAVGLNAGVDVTLGDGGWVLYSNLRYLVATLDAQVRGHAAQSVDYDPWTLGLGFGYSF